MYLAVFLVIGAVGLSGFSSPAQEVSMDPVEVAPSEFKQVLSNEFVRVLHVTVEDGMQTPKHGHPRRVVIFLTDCVWLNEAKDGSIVEETNRKGDVFWIETMVHGGVNHVKETCELLEVELKSSAMGRM